MKRASVVSFTLLAMIAFAANSLLCRFALKQTSIDAASFTAVRIAAGAATLWCIALTRRVSLGKAGTWPSALALFVYAAAFSFAYRTLSAGTGALLLFAAVQATMILWGRYRGERLHAMQFVGLGVAFCGLVVLVFPGISAPPLIGSLLMLSAGVAWGVYSLRGKRGGDPTLMTTGNFIRAVPFALVLAVASTSSLRLDITGVIYALLSGAIASGLGYVIWYMVLPHLAAANAATVQLTVPVIAAAGGILFLHEPLTMRFVFAALAVLGGIA
ncbi:MAG: DMT family transporter, partial [Verrucomicrobiota bacterium]|nr:DMT family transporter [Verrucomicrobiota bacterium]